MRFRHTMTLALLVLGTLPAACSESEAREDTDAMTPAADASPGPSHDSGPTTPPLPPTMPPAPPPTPPAPPPPTPVPVDAGMTTIPCIGLGAAACLAAGCAPVFDDDCCPSCGGIGGACADCTDPSFFECVLLGESGCAMGASCGVIPQWACGFIEPGCGSAHVVDLDSCDRPGCVPAFPPGEGDPSLDAAECVAILGTSCTVGCRRFPPICPAGTVPEADGFCYTNRCIPAFVCR